MFRALVVLFLLANLAFFSWTQGWLDGVVGLRSTGDREPERMQRQVRPETIRILPAASAAAVEAAPESIACLEAGPFDDAGFGAAQAAVQTAVPAGSWVAVDSQEPAVWIVYMGRYATREALLAKQGELNRRRFAFEEVRDNAALVPGLSLGRFDDRAAATNALAQLGQQGIHTARVVELTPPAARHLLRVERADSALAARLGTLKADALGKGFVACVKPS